MEVTVAISAAVRKSVTELTFNVRSKKGKVFPLQARCGPEGG